MSDHLIDHRYTVPQIERMRALVYELMFPITWYPSGCGIRYGSGGMPGEAEAKVEVQLRTYLLAGTRPEELEALVKEREEMAVHPPATIPAATAALPSQTEPQKDTRNG